LRYPRKSRVFITAAVTLAATGAFGGGIASAAPAEQTALTACTRAKIGGQSKCIAAGQFCAKVYGRDYRRYGYTCNNRDRNGRWHLRRR
jgi:hypothetical protein